VATSTPLGVGKMKGILLPVIIFLAGHYYGDCVVNKASEVYDFVKLEIADKGCEIVSKTIDKIKE